MDDLISAALTGFAGTIGGLAAVLAGLLAVGLPGLWLKRHDARKASKDGPFPKLPAHQKITHRRSPDNGQDADRFRPFTG